MSGARSAQDFSTEQAPAPCGTWPNPGAGLMGIFCPETIGIKSTRKQASKTEARTRRLVLNVLGGWWDSRTLVIIASPCNSFTGIITRLDASDTSESRCAARLHAIRSCGKLHFGEKFPVTGIFYIEYRIHCKLAHSHLTQLACLKMRRTMAPHLPCWRSRARNPHAAH